MKRKNLKISLLSSGDGFLQLIIIVTETFIFSVIHKVHSSSLSHQNKKATELDAVLSLNLKA